MEEGLVGDPFQNLKPSKKRVPVVRGLIILLEDQAGFVRCATPALLHAPVCALRLTGPVRRWWMPVMRILFTTWIGRARIWRENVAGCSLTLNSVSQAIASRFIPKIKQYIQYTHTSTIYIYVLLYLCIATPLIDRCFAVRLLATNPTLGSCEQKWRRVDLIINKWRTCLTDAGTEKLVNCYSNLQMLRTLTKKTGDEAFVCWSNVDGEEPLNNDAE